MILTTTQNIEGYTIKEYLGIVSGEAFENKVFRGERFYEPVLSRTRNQVLNQLEEHARSIGADAVIGVSVDFEMADLGPCVLVNATGTAVKTELIKD